MGKYLEALRQQKNAESPNQETDITDICFNHNHASAMSGSYLSEFENFLLSDDENTEKPNRPYNPLDALRNDPDIELLPDDVRWLANLLLGTTLQRRRKHLTEYKRQWLLGMAEADKPHQKQNKGRFRANKWIRKALSDQLPTVR